MQRVQRWLQMPIREMAKQTLQPSQTLQARAVAARQPSDARQHPPAPIADIIIAQLPGVVISDVFGLQEGRQAGQVGRLGR